MTEEEKELLLKDLCARLPYGVKCYYNSPEIDDNVPEGISVIKGFQNDGILVEIESGDVIDIEEIKPYLRPMSSMTEEEKKEYKQHQIKYYKVIYFDTPSSVDWLISKHFDLHLLIPMGLALEAPERMYNI